MAEQNSKYLVVVRLGSASDLGRVSRDMPAFVGILKRLSVSQPECMFKSEGGLVSGFLISSPAPIQVIRFQLETSQATNRHDAVIVVSLGDKVECTVGFTRAATWIQRH